MTTELAVTPEVSDGALVPSFHAVAVNATEMQQSTAQIKSFLERKVDLLNIEVHELTAALDVAVKNKWATKTYRAQLKKAEYRHLYYSKLVTALNAGFTIVPNMEVDIFAIRTNRTVWPKWNGNSGTSHYSYTGASPGVPDEKEVVLPVGKGEYRSPTQIFHETNRKTKDGDKDLYHVTQYCDGYADIEFPFAAAHSVVMDATSNAMAMRIFDRIGIVPQTGRRLRGDPIILGQIVRKEGYSEKVASFLIAWHLDFRTL
jgi:hypothetical protein